MESEKIMQLMATKMQLEAQLYGMHEQAKELDERIAAMERQVSYVAGRIDQVREDAQEAKAAETPVEEAAAQGS